MGFEKNKSEINELENMFLFVDELEDMLLFVHSFYNLSRYLYLNIEWNYNRHVEQKSTTLPQLRVLWITKLFPGISLVEVAQIAGWAPSTVTKILRTLINKGLVTNKETENKKSYSLYVTQSGDNCIENNQIQYCEDFSIFKLKDNISENSIDYINSLLEKIIINLGMDLVIDYVKRMNFFNLKISLDKFSVKDKDLIHKLISFYNYLRIFVLSIEGVHRDILKKTGLTYPQLRALWIIDAFPGVTSIELSRKAYISASTANLIIKNLYKKELIKKEKSIYKNSLYIYITDEGKKLIKADFNLSQRDLIIYSPIKYLSKEQLSKANEILLGMNVTLDNFIVKGYIDKTLEVVKKLL